MVSAVTIRQLNELDDMECLTKVVHAAYAQLGSSGLRFWGTHQSVDDTRSRCADGLCFVALVDGRIVGTVTVKPPESDSKVEIYRDAFTWSLVQFAVLPDYKGAGIGKQLHDAAVNAAISQGARRVALDTAVPATHLIAMYERWGYAIAAECDWRPFTNYASVVMTRHVAPDTTS